MAAHLQQWLIDNKALIQWISSTIAFLSGLFGIFYKDTVKRDPATGRSGLSGWGVFTLVILVLSSSMQGVLLFIENKKATIDEANQEDRRKQEDNLLRSNFASQIDNLRTVSTNLQDFQRSYRKENKANVVRLQETISRTKEIGTDVSKVGDKTQLVLTSADNISREANRSLSTVEAVRKNLNDMRLAEIHKNYQQELVNGARSHLDSVNTWFYNLCESVGGLGFIIKDTRGIYYLRNMEDLGIADMTKIGKVRVDMQMLDSVDEATRMQMQLRAAFSDPPHNQKTTDDYERKVKQFINQAYALYAPGANIIYRKIQGLIELGRLRGQMDSIMVEYEGKHLGDN